MTLDMVTKTKDIRQIQSILLRQIKKAVFQWFTCLSVGDCNMVIVVGDSPMDTFLDLGRHHLCRIWYIYVHLLKRFVLKEKVPQQEKHGNLLRLFFLTWYC